MNQNPNFDYYSFLPPQGKADQAIAPPTDAPVTTPIAPVVSDGALTADDSAAAAKAHDRALRRRTRRAHSRVGWAFAALMVVWYVSANLLSALLSSASLPAWLDADVLSMLIGTLPLYVLALPLYALCLGGMPHGQCDRRKFGVPQCLGSVCMSMGLMTLGALVGNFIMLVISNLSGHDYSSIVDTMAEVPLWLTALLSCVLAPIFEELIFRKIMLDRLLPYGERSAVLISALLFGLMHGNLYQFFYAFLLGILFGYVYVRTGRWWHCVVLHAIVNFIGGVLGTLVTQLIDLDALSLMSELDMVTYLTEHPLELLALLGYEALTYGLGLVGIILLIVFGRRHRATNQSMELSRRRAAPKWLNSGMLVTFALCAGLFALYFASFHLA